jgi:hypothetical protein
MDAADRIESLTGWDDWRTSLPAAMLEATVALAAERHPGIHRLLAGVHATLEQQWRPPGTASGWLVTGTPLSADAVRVVAARHAADRGDEPDVVPVAHLTVQQGETTSDLAYRLILFVGRNFQPASHRLPAGGPVVQAARTLAAAGTSLVVLDRIDRLEVTERLGTDLATLATDRVMVAMRPDEHQDVEIGPFGDTKRATVSSLGLWMRKVDMRDLDDDALRQTD